MPAMIEQLPTDPFVTLLECLGVPLAVKLAVCSKTLQRKIFENEEVRKAFWVLIGFYEFRGRITDYDLKNLLVKVNAREVTKILDLDHLDGRVTRINGPGILPLKNSCVLEEILLPEQAKSNLVPFLPTLWSMVPHKLHRICIPFALHDLPSDHPMVEFTRSLRLTKLEQAQEQESICKSCNECLFGKALQQVYDEYGPRETICEGCKKHFCHRFTCPAALTECSKCHDSFCKDCRSFYQCNDCFISICSECAYEWHSIKDCKVCKRYFCEACDKTVDCRDFDCLNRYCPDCRDTVPTCDKCNRLYCPETCGDECSKCRGHFCLKCQHDCSGSNKRKRED